MCWSLSLLLRKLLKRNKIELTSSDQIAVLSASFIGSTAFAFTDFFVICSGLHPRQVKAIAEGIEDQLRQCGSKPAVIEGTEHAEWILLDFFDFVVHVFTPDVREFYGLEQLWGSAERLEVDESEAAE